MRFFLIMCALNIFAGCAICDGFGLDSGNTLHGYGLNEDGGCSENCVKFEESCYCK